MSKNNNNLRTYSMDLKLSSIDLLLLNKLSYHSACLYNYALYGIRQAWFNDNKILSYAKDTYYKIKENEHFSILLNDSSSQIVRKTHQDFNSFLGLLKLKKKGQYDQKIKLPRYKKDKFKNTTLNDIIVQGRSVRFVRENKNTNTFRINMSKTFKKLYPESPKFFDMKTPKNIEKINEIKLSPSNLGKSFKLQVVFKGKENLELKKDNGRYLSIDLGINNFAACVDSSNGYSFFIDGKKIKSINQYYNKSKAKIQSRIDLSTNKTLISQLNNKLHKLSKKRDNKIKAFFHLSTKYIVNYCSKNNINTVIIGENKEQKQEINIGKKNNQNFVSIPFFKFKNILEYKLNEKSIALVRHEESYTSKTSFLDLEEVKKHSNYVGIRSKRGLFKSQKGILINADINGAINILRKFLISKDKIKEWVTLFFSEVCRGIVNYPKKLTYESLLLSMTSNKNSLL